MTPGQFVFSNISTGNYMTGETSHCYNEYISFNFLGLTNKIALQKHIVTFGRGGGALNISLAEEVRLSHSSPNFS